MIKDLDCVVMGKTARRSGIHRSADPVSGG
jgi:hypothetical protein